MQMIRLKDVLNEGKSVDGWVLVNGWEKAMDVAKSMGAWSPHMRKKYKTDPVGYTNSDILGKIPKKWADKTWFAFHDQAMDSALTGHNNWSRPLMISWGGDGKLIVKILKKAGFKKVSGGKDETKKILIHPVGPKPYTDKSVVPDGFSTHGYPD
jgi:hypothetical protein